MESHLNRRMDGRVSYPVALSRWYEIAVQVNEQTITTSTNGKKMLTHDLPGLRSDGAFALFTFDAVGEFDRVELASL